MKKATQLSLSMEAATASGCITPPTLKTLQDSTNPAGVACDAEGMFWVAARDNHCVKGH